MVTKITTATTIGLQVQPIEVEVDVTPGLPAVIVVGLPDKAIQESRERIRSSIKQSGYEFPLGKVTINLAPADVVKAGSSLDVPMALGVLRLTGDIPNELPQKSLFLGELSLDGSLRSVTGILSICLWAKNHGYASVYIPNQNIPEAQLVSDITIYPVKNLASLVLHLNHKQPLQAITPLHLPSLSEHSNAESDKLHTHDMAYIRGQTVAKRALEIAAAGGHNILLIGQPGSGKTLLARSFATILPRMNEQEILETTQIYSVAGLLKEGNIKLKRPFRSPHHSSSHVALVGGGTKLRPGEISLAHRGVLFLDEFAEFSRESIEALRQPLEDGFVSISRVSGSVTYPSRFNLIAAANPTPSGYNPNDPDKPSQHPINQSAIARYQAKFSGPILDRIDLQVEVNRPHKDELQKTDLAESSETIRQRVQKARDIQTNRFLSHNIQTNSEMTLPLIRTFCSLDKDGEKLLSQAIERFKMSARSYMRILKLSRTIADLDGHIEIMPKHIAESLQYRGRFG